MVEDSRHLAIQNPNFFPVEKAGKIKVVLGHATSYNDVNIALTVKTRTDETRDIGGVDIVILATGFDLSLDFLSNEIKSRLFNEFGQLQLFRNLYNPELPQMGFLGFHLNANQMLTPAIASRWLVELAKGKDGALYKRGVLDDKTTMYKSINAGVCWERQFYKDPTLANGIYTTGFGVHPYLDCIMTELGSKRFLDQGSRGFVASFTEPLLPAQFKGFINAPLET